MFYYKRTLKVTGRHGLGAFRRCSQHAGQEKRSATNKIRTHCQGVKDGRHQRELCARRDVTSNLWKFNPDKKETFFCEIVIIFCRSQPGLVWVEN